MSVGARSSGNGVREGAGVGAVPADVPGTDPAVLLAIDTSTETMAVAAVGPRGARCWNGPGGAVASTHLVPQVHAVLAEAGLVLADVQAIAFGRGPGAFTGLRTSCAVAQGLGFGLGRLLLPIDSLLIVAEDALGASDTVEQVGEPQVAVAMDARMDEIYGGVYRRAASGWQTVHEPALHTLASWNDFVAREGASLDVMAGSALAAFGDRLHRPASLRLHGPESDRAAALLRLARQAHAAGQGIDADQALPLYLRDKVALTTAERTAARAANEAARAAGAGP